MNIYEIEIYTVTCVTKPNKDSRHESIRALGGAGWKYTAEEIITMIQSEKYMFFTISGTTIAPIKVIPKNGGYYLRTVRNGQETDNLLSLPDCR